MINFDSNRWEAFPIHLFTSSKKSDDFGQRSRCESHLWSYKNDCDLFRIRVGLSNWFQLKWKSKNMNCLCAQDETMLIEHSNKGDPENVRKFVNYQKEQFRVRWRSLRQVPAASRTVLFNRIYWVRLSSPCSTDPTDANRLNWIDSCRSPAVR